MGVLAESSPASQARLVGWQLTARARWRSGHVRHLEAEEATDLGDASGMVADAESAVMGRSVVAPAVNELGRGQGEGNARGGVSDVKRGARK
jgi:hypothetical protein